MDTIAVESRAAVAPMRIAYPLGRIPPIYAVAVAVLIGDALGNLHLAIPLWIAIAASLIALGAFLTSRRTLGLIAAYLAISSVATLSVSRVLEPPIAAHSIRTFIDGAKVTITGRIFREPERETYGVRLYVALDSAAEQGAILAPASGTIRISVLQGGTFRLGDQLRLSGRLRFPRNNGNPGEFDYAALMAREGIDATIFTRANLLGTAAFQITGNRARFPASQIERIRNRIGGFIDRNLAYPQNAEMRALVIGDRGEIGQPLRETFARTGMAHLLVISGLHLSLVAATAFAIARLIAMILLPGLASRGYANKSAAIAAAIAVCAYASIAGHHVSTVRALVMVLAYMFAIMIDRSREAIASLALAALIICIALPGSTGDIGFQLSFASVIAIVLGMRRFAAWFARRKRLGRLPGEPSSRAWTISEGALGYLAVSFWAMLGTAPLTAFHFNQFALVGVLANAVVVPIMAFGATISGLLAAALSFFSEPLARPVLLFGASALAIGNWLAEWFVGLPMAWARIFTPTPLELALAYAMLALWMLSPLAASIPPSPLAAPIPPSPVAASISPSPLAASIPPSPLAPSIPPSPVEKNLRLANFIFHFATTMRHLGWRATSAAALALVIVMDAGYWSYDRFFNPALRVTFLSVGEGDGAVVRFPGSHVMLIDGGASYGGFDAGERIVAPYLWSKKIMRVDYLVLTHPDADHFGGLDFIATNFLPRALWTISARSDDVSYARLMADLKRENIPVIDVDVAAVAPIPTIGGVTIESLNRDSATAAKLNNRSMVLRLIFGDISFLFTGDIEAAGERALIASAVPLHATVLKVPHHGSKTSSTPAFIAAIHPQAAVISDGYLNRFRFPSAAVVDRYVESGIKLYRTDNDGAVIVSATRTGLTMRTFRTPAP